MAVGGHFRFLRSVFTVENARKRYGGQFFKEFLSSVLHIFVPENIRKVPFLLTFFVLEDVEMLLVDHHTPITCVVARIFAAIERRRKGFLANVQKSKAEQNVRAPFQKRDLWHSKNKKMGRRALP